MGEVLTASQAKLLCDMGETFSALRNYDEGSPKWWIEGGAAVRESVARAVLRRGFVRLTGHWGGQPGTLGFTVSDAGRQALASQPADQTRQGEPDHG